MFILNDKHVNHTENLKWPKKFLPKKTS